MAAEQVIRNEPEIAGERSNVLAEAVNPKILRAAQRILVKIEGAHVEQDVAALQFQEVQDRIAVHTEGYAASVESPSKQRRAEYAAKRLVDHLQGKTDADIKAAYDLKINVKQERTDLIDNVSKFVGAVAIPLRPETVEPRNVPSLTEAVTMFGLRHQLTKLETDALIDRLDDEKEPGMPGREAAHALRTVQNALAIHIARNPGLLTADELRLLSEVTGYAANSEEVVVRKSLYTLAKELANEGRNVQVSSIMAAALSKIDQ